ncbi:MAG: hypothetical protein AAAB16_23895 [Pseudomonas sp.]|uniref:hypothetical protein n=1 Tax=Pseudomonas sp. TaxID=306 RepID=UPI0030F26225
MTNLLPNELEQAQTAVFVLIGKCILNLQLYEQALKNLLPYFEVSNDGPTPEQQREKLAKLTLGSLIRQLIKRAADFDEDAEEPKRSVTNSIVIRTRFRIPVDAKEAKQLYQNLDELLHKRNFLVHHFRSEHSLKTDSGCRAAKTYLDGLYEQTKTAIAQIDGIGRELKSSTASLIKFLGSDEAAHLIEEFCFEGESVISQEK